MNKFFSYNTVSCVTSWHRKDRHKYCNAGFSLSELLVTLSLVAIVAAFSIPSYQDALDKQLVVNGAEVITAFIGTVRSESLKRNRIVSVSYATGQNGSWCIGATLDQTPCDCMQTDELDSGFCAIDSAAWVLRNSDVQAKNLISSMSGDGAYAFEPIRGIFMDPADRPVFDLGSDEDYFQVKLHVVSNGQATLCLPAPASDIPGINSCVE